MSARELVVLGTSSQVPTRHRNQGGYLLRWDGAGILVDPGEGTQRQMTWAGVAASAVTHVLVTHFHGDHCLGLPGLFQRFTLDGLRHRVEVHFPASGRAFLERLRDASIHVEEPELSEHPIEREGPIAQAEGLRIEARRLDHTVDTFGYRVEEPPGRSLLPERLAALGIQGPDVGRLVREGTLPVGGRRVTLEAVSVPRPGQSVAFVMDTRPCPGAHALARDADLLVCEATYLAEHTELAHRRGHMTAGQAAELAREAGARRLLLTHFSSRYRTVEAFLEEAGALHPDVVAAEDGMRVSLPPRRPGADSPTMRRP